MKLFKHYLLLAAIFVLPLLPLFLTRDMVHTHDGPVHLARIAAYYKALLDGQFPPRWAGELNYGYGTPVFIFMYPFPYLLGALYVALGASLALSFKLILATSFVLSGIFFYGWMYALTKDRPISLLATFVYQFAPYRLVELTVRGSMAEAFGFTFTPLILWMLTKFSVQPTVRYGTLISLATMFLILSHNSISLVFFGIICLYVLFMIGKANIRHVAFTCLAAGVGLAAFYWLPALLEHKYTYGDLFMKDMYRSHFAPFIQFFLPNFTNDSSLQTGGVTMWIGLTQTIAIVVSVWALAKKKLTGLQRPLVLFALLILGISFLFMTPVSMMIWERISFLRQFQFPWRLLAPVAFTTAILSIAYTALIKRRRWIMIVLILVTTVSTISYWRPPLGFDRIDEAYFWNYPLNTTFFGEADIIWSAGPASGFPANRVEVRGGEASIRDFVRHTSWHSFLVYAQGDTTLVSNTQYFPGWRVTVDGQKVPIQFQDPTSRGLLQFTVPDGLHHVVVEFGRSKARLAGELVTLVAVLLLIGANLVYRKKLI